MTTTPMIELRSKRPSWLIRLVSWLVTKRPPVFPLDAASVTTFLDGRDLPPDAPLPGKIAQGFMVEQWQAVGHPCITLHPKAGKGQRHILYCHGGGFVLPMLEAHWPLVAKLVEWTGASVTVPLYPVAPEATREAQDAVVDAAFARLARDWAPGDLVLAGDSAGGHMALALALRLVRSDGPQPGKLVLFAPWLDVALQDEAMRAVEPHDNLLKIDALRAIGAAWAGKADPASPECSPLRAPGSELAQLPPMQIYVGRHDIFVIDSRSFAARLQAAGGPVQLFEYAGAPHVFMVITPTREAKDCFALVRDFLKN